MKWLCLLAPLGAVLGLVFSAKTCSDLLEICITRVEEIPQLDLARWHIIGVMGWFLFGAGLQQQLSEARGRAKENRSLGSLLPL